MRHAQCGLNSPPAGQHTLSEGVLRQARSCRSLLAGTGPKADWCSLKVTCWNFALHRQLPHQRCIGTGVEEALSEESPGANGNHVVNSGQSTYLEGEGLPGAAELAHPAALQVSQHVLAPVAQLVFFEAVLRGENLSR